MNRPVNTSALLGEGPSCKLHKTFRASAHHSSVSAKRTGKSFDASQSAYDGVMEQKWVFLYDTSWRIIDEHIDIDSDTSPGTDWKSQHLWGLRYADGVWVPTRSWS